MLHRCVKRYGHKRHDHKKFTRHSTNKIWFIMKNRHRDKRQAIILNYIECVVETSIVEHFSKSWWQLNATDVYNADVLCKYWDNAMFVRYTVKKDQLADAIYKLRAARFLFPIVPGSTSVDRTNCTMQENMRIVLSICIRCKDIIECSTTGLRCTTLRNPCR